MADHAPDTYNGICASMKGTGASAGTIRYLAHQLLEHGCRRCGSVSHSFMQKLITNGVVNRFP